MSIERKSVFEAAQRIMLDGIPTFSDPLEYFKSDSRKQDVKLLAVFTLEKLLGCSWDGTPLFSELGKDQEDDCVVPSPEDVRSQIDYEYLEWVATCFKNPDGTPIKLSQVQFNTMRDAFNAGIHTCNEVLRETKGYQHMEIRQALLQLLMDKVDASL